MADQLSRSEFLTHMELLRGDIKGVQDRLDLQNGRIRSNEIDIATLKERSGSAADPAARWGAVGSGLGAAIAGALAYFK